MLSVFGINSDGLNLAVNLLILFVVVIYVALIYWTYTDALRRISDPMLVMCATAVSLIPFVGAVLYVIVRPPEYLDDIRERELEMQASEARLADLNYMLCPHCEYEVEKDFLRCPNCLRRLRAPCGTCRRPLDPTWKICPYCESELSGSEGRVRRRATAGEP